MEKITSEFYNEADSDEVILALLNKQDEIVKWINEMEPILKPKAVSAGKSEISRYQLSNDKTGLIAYLPGGTFYHIHCNELTADQRLIRNQLVDMEG